MKKYILSITPNPALDLSGVVDNIVPNEKCYVHDEIKSPGGNGINAARILTRLGIPVSATGFAGGSTGQEIKSLLDNEGVKTKFLPVKGHTRICVTVSNRKDHQQTRLTFPGPKISRTEAHQLFDFVNNDKNISLLIFGGSLPEGFSTSELLRLMKLAQKRKMATVVDCPGRFLPALIKGKPLLIKPNLIEFQELVGKKVKTISAVQKQARSLLSQVPYICISSVEGGALLVTKEGAWFGRIPKVKIKSTVGAGDSMVGAMVAQIVQNKILPENMLRWGLAAAAATLAQKGTTLGSAKEIHRLYRQTTVKKVV